MFAERPRAGDRVELELQAGNHEAGERGVVLEVERSTAMVEFDRSDEFGGKIKVVELADLRRCRSDD